MEPQWTLPELVAEVAARIAALPAPKNGQVRAVPDDRTVRYYGTLGLLDRPSAMRGRTALYGRKHVAQVVAIKRLQAMGRSLSEIQQLWPTLDDVTLARMSGVELPITARPARAEFWKREPRPSVGAGGVPEVLEVPEVPEVRDANAGASAAGAMPEDVTSSDPATLPRARIVKAGPPRAPAGAGEKPDRAVELRIELAPGVVLSLSVADDSVAISPADVRAVRAAAAPLLDELASRRLAFHSSGEQA